MVLGTATEFIVEALQSATAGTYGIEFELEALDINGDIARVNLADRVKISLLAGYGADEDGIVYFVSVAIFPTLEVLESREFRLVFREADINDIIAPSGNIIDRVEIPAGGRGFSVPVWLSLEGVNGSTLADDESVEVTVSFSSLNDQFSAIFNTDASTAVLSTLNPRGLVVLDLPLRAGTVEVEVFSATVFAMVDPNQAGLPAANFIGATLPVRAVREVGLVFDIGPMVEVARGGSTPLSVTTEPLLIVGEVVTARLTVDPATGLSFDGANTYEIEIRLDSDQPSQMLDLFATATAPTGAVVLGVEVADRENVIVNLPTEPLSIEVFERQFRLVFQNPNFTAAAYSKPAVSILIEGLDNRSVLFADEEVYAVFEYRGVVRGRVLLVEDSVPLISIQCR